MEIDVQQEGSTRASDMRQKRAYRRAQPLINKHITTPDEAAYLSQALVEYFAKPDRSVERQALIDRTYQEVQRRFPDPYWSAETIRRWFNNNKTIYLRNTSRPAPTPLSAEVPVTVSVGLFSSAMEARPPVVIEDVTPCVPAEIVPVTEPSHYELPPIPDVPRPPGFPWGGSVSCDIPPSRMRFEAQAYAGQAVPFPQDDAMALGSNLREAVGPSGRSKLWVRDWAGADRQPLPEVLECCAQNGTAAEFVSLFGYGRHFASGDRSALMRQWDWVDLPEIQERILGFTRCGRLWLSGEKNIYSLGFRGSAFSVPAVNPLPPVLLGEHVVLSYRSVPELHLHRGESDRWSPIGVQWGEPGNGASALAILEGNTCVIGMTKGGIAIRDITSEVTSVLSLEGVPTSIVVDEGTFVVASGDALQYWTVRERRPIFRIPLDTPALSLFFGDRILAWSTWNGVRVVDMRGPSFLVACAAKTAQNVQGLWYDHDSDELSYFQNADESFYYRVPGLHGRAEGIPAPFPWFTPAQGIS